MARSQKNKQSAKTGPAADAASVEPGDATRRLYLIVAAFVAGAAVMIVELAGNRVLAPWFGNSLYTWTGLIGVIMISLSVGYYLGGYLADRRPSYAVLAHLLAAAAVLTILIPSFQAGVDKSLRALDVISGPVIATTLLFALPGCLLAAVSPFAIRMVSLLSNDRHVGLSAGAIGTSATLGSVVGTFATGFVLVPHLRLQTIFVTTGLTLALLAVVGYLLFAASFRRRKSLGLVLVGLFALIGVAAVSGQPPRSPLIVFEEQTFYHRIRVIEQPVPDRDDVIRYLFLDSTREGSQFVKSRRMSEPYQRYWELVRLFRPDLKKAVFLGGGAYAMPEALLDAYPEATADVVEIDPAVIETGRKYFRVDDYPRMNAVADDARRFLQSSETRYDLIYGDAFRGVACIPPHLVTVEFFELVKDRLNDGGVFIVNVAGSIEGPRARLFHSVAKTLAEVFPYQCVFATDPEHPDRSQNVCLVASDHDLKPETFAEGRFSGPESLAQIVATYLPSDRYNLADGVVFRDDFNPVEYLVAQSLEATPD